MTTIEKIHHEFDTAQDRILKQALEVINSTDMPKVDYIEQKAERLKKLGFTSSVAVKEGERLASERNLKIKTVEMNREQAELVRYYKQKYPFYKFLTEDELDRICKKYSLVYATADRYLKDIPEKNLKELENGKVVEDEDTCDIVYKLNGGDKFKEFMSFLGFDECKINSKDYISLIEKYYSYCPVDWRSIADSNTGLFVIWDRTGRVGDYTCDTIEITKKEGNFIAAPKSHFNLKSLKKHGFGFFEVFKTEVKDPVVFQYVKGGLLVKTKWGDEAEDELLINETFN